MTEQIGKVSVGQAQVVELLLALFSRGRHLLVGAPGLARTLLVSPVSQVLHLSFKRTQFLPENLEKSPAG
jgi:MoxR-like ATPase